MHYKIHVCVGEFNSDPFTNVSLVFSLYVQIFFCIVLKCTTRFILVSYDSFILACHNS